MTSDCNNNSNNVGIQALLPYEIKCIAKLAKSVSFFLGHRKVLIQNSDTVYQK
jgi:hypothetical protein